VTQIFKKYFHLFYYWKWNKFEC